jgi:hypothetical protein
MNDRNSKERKRENLVADFWCRNPVPPVPSPAINSRLRIRHPLKLLRRAYPNPDAVVSQLKES